MSQLSEPTSAVGVVAIGRNEGERLVACLQSALRDVRHVVYVDSGSSDGSAASAKELGAHVVQLDLSTPFTAARSRNAGFAKLMEVAPQTEFVQFVDGDCQIVEGWITYARESFTALPKAAVVCGRRRERFPDRSVYNLLCDIEWNTPVGEARSCGGDAMIRTSAFRQVNGYDASVIAGEEPEMCVRLRRAGWTIHRLDHEMTLHDAAMFRLGQWWKRNVRAGHAFAEGYAMHGTPPERHRVRETRSNWVNGLLIPSVVIAATIAVAVWKPLFASLVPAAAAMLYLLLWARYRMRLVRRGLSRREASLYAAFVMLGKLPQALGQVTYFWNRLRGRKTRLIEYKGASKVVAA
jgi:glycosyltransferase involved in cell wall biosynthesis